MMELGRLLFRIGIGVAVLGGLLWLAGRWQLPLGRLPGDIRVERENFVFYAPLGTSLLLSLLLTLALNLLSRLK